MKPWRFISLWGFVSLFGGGAGCALETGDEPREEAEASTGVDSAMLDAALVNQATLEEAGHRLLGRVWFARDGYGELYEREDGETLALFFARSGTKDAVDTNLVPVEGEALETYVTRAARGRTPRYLQRGTESGPDVLLFDPVEVTQRTDGLGKSSEAVVNEMCPKSQYDSLCTLRWGYEGPTTLVSSWNVFDRTATATFSGTGSSYMTVLCADRGSATLTVSAPGGSIVTVGLQVPQGVWAISFQAVSFGRSRSCGFLSICCDYVERPNRTRFTVSASPASGSNVHSCGKILDRHDNPSYNSCGAPGSGDPFWTPPRKGFLDANGALSASERSKFCSTTCSRSCAGATGLGQIQCMNSCTSQCMAGG